MRGSLDGLIRIFENFPDKARSLIEAAEKENLEEAYAAALLMSSGPYSQKELDEMDNPYAKRHPGILLEPKFMINVQTGRFFAGWHKWGPEYIGGEFTSTLGNSTPEADYLQPGTVLMWNRPIDQAILQVTEVRRFKRSTEAIHKALKPLTLD